MLQALQMLGRVLCNRSQQVARQRLRCYWLTCSVQRHHRLANGPFCHRLRYFLILRRLSIKHSFYLLVHQIPFD